AHHCLGNLKFISEEHDVPPEAHRRILELEREGKTVIISADKRHVKGIIALADTLREGSREAVESLKKMGIKPIILSGDNPASVAHFGSVLGIEDSRGGLLPEDKVRSVSGLVADGRCVAMVGDGVNDTPALASASVGIAMGAAGSDSAIETSDVVVMNNDLRTVAHLIRLGRECSKRIRLNIALAIGLKAIVLLAAVLGFANLALAIFADVGVTLVVVVNGLGLFGYE
ncbi:MAG: HAD-IC family P-type ATPase, partial [Candidatus Marsarchaeota archaeon]|nr:HAD-IC family P-type ATPase [Candidatus Marsarchaeota archaeon]